MKIGLCAFRKSGNYLLIRTLKALLEQLGLWSSYNAANRCWAGCFAPEDLSYPEEEEIDELYVEGRSIVLAKGPRRLRYQADAWDLDGFNEQARLVLTHQTPLRSHFELFGCDRKWIYLVRDGRDAVNSWMYYAVSPILRKRHPHEYTIDEVGDLYGLPGYMEKHARLWNEHVAAYLCLRDRYLLVRYEDLTARKAEQIRAIAEYLGVSGDIDVDAIVEATGFDTMKRQAPVHVRRGGSRQWSEHFSGSQREAFKATAGRSLIALGYERTGMW